MAAARKRSIRPLSCRSRGVLACGGLLVLLLLASGHPTHAETVKPVLHGRHWVAVAGKPLASTAGARIFLQGGNAVDAACAMIAASATIWDVLSWGGETQALIYNPHTRKVVGVNALGVAPTGATPEFYRSKGYQYPPEYGPLAAITPGTPGGILVMLAEFGTLSLAQVLAPAIELAEGYPMDGETAERIERSKDVMRAWPASRRTFLVREGQADETPAPGEIFRQPDLARTLRRLVEAETRALAAGATRKQAIMAAYQRFYEGDIAREFVSGAREVGALITLADLANWRVYLEEPVHTNYRGVDVYKLTTWVQGPAMLQALNILENFDLAAMGYNSARYIHTLYQAMSMAFADRDFYYGDPRFPPRTPIRGLLSKEYARDRAKSIRFDRNDPDIKPGDPYPYQGEKNPFRDLLESWRTDRQPVSASAETDRTFRLGTTTVEAADKEGWVVSVTPSGGWLPAVIAGRTGMGMSQRMQSFVLDRADACRARAH